MDQSKINGVSSDSLSVDEHAFVPSPRPNSRLHPESESFAARNRQGCGERWYDYSDYGIPENNPAISKVSSETEERDSLSSSYAVRNREGCGGKWFDHTPNENPDVVVNNNNNHTDRMPSREARQNYETHQGTIKDCFGGYCDPAPVRTVHPRAITSQSQQTAEANKGGNMRHLLDDYGKGTRDRPPVAKLKGDLAFEYAERNKGARENVINNYGVQTPTDDQVKEKMNHISRVVKEDSMTSILKMEPEAQRAPSRGYGKLHAESNESWDELPPQRHCRPEGAAISRHMDNKMADIMSMAGPLSPIDRKPRDAPPHLTETPTPRPPAAHMTTEARQNYERDHSNISMNAIFGRETSDIAPQKVRVNRMMQRSEEW